MVSSTQGETYITMCLGIHYRKRLSVNISDYVREQFMQRPYRLLPMHLEKANINLTWARVGGYQLPFHGMGKLLGYIDDLAHSTR